MDAKIYFESEIGYIPIDLNKFFQMKPLAIKISLSIKCYDEKTAGRYRNGYVAEKRIFPYYQIYRSQSVITQIRNLNGECHNSILSDK